MSIENTEDKPKPVKHQIYLGGELQEALDRYIKENYAPGSRVVTAIFRRAMMEFLKGKGYYVEEGEEVMPIQNHN